MTAERIKEILSRYGVLPEFLYRLPDSNECISYPGPMEVAMCKVTFREGFHFPLHPFIKRLLARYRLVPT